MKYRGADGWVNDDGVGPRRYEHREDTKPRPKAKKPKKGEADSDPTELGDSADGTLACCGLFGLSVIACLVGMGMGYGAGGWGGLLVGLGIGAVLPVGLIFWMSWATRKKE